VIPVLCGRGHDHDQQLGEVGGLSRTGCLWGRRTSAPFHDATVLQSGGRGPRADARGAEFGQCQGYSGHSVGSAASRCPTTAGWEQRHGWNRRTCSASGWRITVQEMDAPGQTAILFVDSASTRGNLRAVMVFRKDNILIIAFPPHLTPAAGGRDLGSALQERFRAEVSILGAAGVAGGFSCQICPARACR
jgi:hypothetical protein